MSLLTKARLTCTHPDCDYSREGKYTDPEAVAKGETKIHRQLAGDAHEVVVQEQVSND